MPLWGPNGNTAPKWGNAYALAGSGTSGNTSLVFVDSTQISGGSAAQRSGSGGWYLKKQGSGGRAGRVNYESLVAFSAKGSVSIGEPVSTIRGWLLTANNTGLAGVGIDRNTLPLYTGPSKPAAGTTISMKKITTPLVLNAGNITLDRCWHQPTTPSGLGGLIFTYDPEFGPDHKAPGPIIIKDCDLDASAITDPGVYVECAVRGVASVYRCNIWGGGSGIAIQTDLTNTAMPDVVIQNNLIHDLRSGIYDGVHESHNEAGTCRAFVGNSLTIRDNSFVSLSGQDTGAFFIQDSGGPIQNITLTGNYFSTGAWCIPVEAASGYTVTKATANNNRFVHVGYGASYWNGGQGWWDHWNDNYWYDNTQVDFRGDPIYAFTG